MDTVLHATCSHRPLPPWKLADLGMWIPWASLVTGWKWKIRKFPVQTLWQKVSVVTPIISKLQCELRQPRELGKRNMTEKCLSQQPFLPSLTGKEDLISLLCWAFFVPLWTSKGGADPYGNSHEKIVLRSKWDHSLCYPLPSLLSVGMHAMVCRGRCGQQVAAF